MVTVHGGRIVAIAPIGCKLSSKDLHEQQQEEAPREAAAPRREPQPREPIQHPSYGGIMLLQESSNQA